MFDDLAGFFYDNVIAAYNTYVEKRDTPSGRFRHTRSAVELATALFHFREHLPPEHAKTRSQVERECPDYRLIADVVNAAKHRFVKNSTPQGPSLVAQAEAIEETTICTKYTDADGDYTDARTSVIVACSDGVSRNLDDALITVLNYWSLKLKEVGVLDVPPFPQRPHPGSHFVSREAAKPPDLEVVQGVRWKQKLQILEFNPVKGHAEPIDLTGAQLELRIYKPTYSANIKLTPRGEGDPIDISFDLNEEQSIAVHHAKTDAERENLMKSFFEERREEICEKIEQTLQAREAAKPSEDDVP